MFQIILQNFQLFADIPFYVIIFKKIDLILYFNIIYDIHAVNMTNDVNELTVFDCQS